MVNNKIWSLIIGILGSYIANELGLLRPFLEKYFYIIVLFGLCLIVYFLYNNEKRMKAELNRVLQELKNKESEFQIRKDDEFKIKRLGIKEIYSRKDKSIESIIKEPNESYEWFGLSAYKEITDIYNIRTFKTKRDVKYKYYILNNLSKINLHACQDRGDDYVKDNIDLALRSVQNNKFENLKCYSYEIIPSFRLAFIDDKKLYLGYYPPKGHDSPVIEISREEQNGDADPTESCNLYIWFKYYFETMKKETIKRRIEKEILMNMIKETNDLGVDELYRQIETNSDLVQRYNENFPTYPLKNFIIDIFEEFTSGFKKIK